MNHYYGTEAVPESWRKRFGCALPLELIPQET